ncbi:MAG: zinc ribbon domain-containing protein [Fimbriimonadaceae bacterium]
MENPFLTEPIWLVTGCLAWVPVTIWIVCLVNWMVTLEIDWPSGILGIVVGVLLGWFSLNPPVPALAPVFATAALATLVLTPLARYMMDRSQMIGIDIDAIERAYQVLGEKPTNFGGKIKLARALYDRGVYRHAIALAEDALGKTPENMFLEERRLLNQWKVAPMPPSAVDEIRCVECGTMNKPGQVFCSGCGGRYLLEYAKGKVVKRSVAKKMTASWLAGVLALVGIPTSLTAFPPLVAVFVIAVLGVLGAVVLLRAFKDEPQVAVR